MFCPYCGKEVQDSAKFCPICGSRLDTLRGQSAAREEKAAADYEQVAESYEEVAETEPAAQEPAMREQPEQEAVEEDFEEDFEEEPARENRPAPEDTTWFKSDPTDMTWQTPKQDETWADERDSGYYGQQQPDTKRTNGKRIALIVSAGVVVLVILAAVVLFLVRPDLFKRESKKAPESSVALEEEQPSEPISEESSESSTQEGSEEESQEESPAGGAEQEQLAKDLEERLAGLGGAEYEYAAIHEMDLYDTLYNTATQAMTDQDYETAAMLTGQLEAMKEVLSSPGFSGIAIRDADFSTGGLINMDVYVSGNPANPPESGFHVYEQPAGTQAYEEAAGVVVKASSDKEVYLPIDMTDETDFVSIGNSVVVAASSGYTAVLLYTDQLDAVDAESLKPIVQAAVGAGMPILTVAVGEGEPDANSMASVLAQKTGGIMLRAKDDTEMQYILDHMDEALPREFHLTYQTKIPKDGYEGASLFISYLGENSYVRYSDQYSTEIAKQEEKQEDSSASAAADDSDEYILPDSGSRYLTGDDLRGLSKEELRLARNEIYARKGRRFNDAELQSYFDSKSWYNGTIAPESFSESMLNEYEKANIELIKDYEGIG